MTTTATRNSTDQMLLTRAIREAEGYRELGMPSQGLVALQRRGSLVHGDNHACYLLGETLRELSRYQEAIAPLQRSAELDPAEIYAWLALGWCYKRIGRLPAAIESLENGLYYQPKEAILHYNLGCYWSLAGDRSRALDHLGQALRLDGAYRELIADESDFDPIRNDLGFQLMTGVVV